MTAVQEPEARVHAVQFYDGQRYLHRAIVRFFAEAQLLDANRGGVVARPCA